MYTLHVPLTITNLVKVDDDDRTYLSLAHLPTTSSSTYLSKVSFPSLAPRRLSRLLFWSIVFACVVHVCVIPACGQSILFLLHSSSLLFFPSASSRCIFQACRRPKFFRFLLSNNQEGLVVVVNTLFLVPYVIMSFLVVQSKSCLSGLPLHY